LEKLGAEVVQGDLTNLADLHRMFAGCHRVYFGMSAADDYLEAALTTAAVARHYTDLEVFVNISQLTVSSMNVFETTDSTQQKHHWLVEQALNWSGLPVVHLRATVFMEHPFFTLLAKGTIQAYGEIRLPFGNARTSPIATVDVARVASVILANPQKYLAVKRVYELTGHSYTLDEMAHGLSQSLGREVKYRDLPHEEWKATILDPAPLTSHVKNHFETMAKLHKANQYDRQTTDVQLVLGRSPTTFEQWSRDNTALFA
jgi:uncharacterized protein YbjT (DUF2867 family)